MSEQKENPWAKTKDENFSPEVKLLNFSGKTTIRMLPAVRDIDLPFFKYKMHYINGNYVTHNAEIYCPICTFASSLFETNEEKYNLYKGKLRYDTYVHTDAGIQLLICNIMLARKIFALADKYGDPTDVQTGYTITVQVNKKGKYEDYVLMADKGEAPVSPAVMKELALLKRINQIRKFTTEDKIKEILDEIN